MSIKKNLPNIPLYIGDWERDCNVLSLEAEGAWLRIIFKMWNKGRQSSIKIPTKSLQNLWRCSKENMNEIIDELIYNEICEISKNEMFIEFTCRRFLKENKISEARSKAGKSSKKENKNKSKPEQKANKSDQNTENENENDIVIKNKNEENKNEEKIDFQKITDIYNQKLPMLPQVQVLSDRRKSAIRARIKKFKPDNAEIFFESIFEKTSQSNFLTGLETDWKANFDWILNENNLIKILEGNYKNKTNINGKQQKQADTFIKNLQGWN